MDLMKLYDKDFNLLQGSLALQMKRQAVIQANIANVSTPKYKERSFNFEQSLQEATAPKNDARFLTKTREGHMAMTPPPAVVKKKMTTGRIDGNNVDIDHQMMKMSENQIDFNTVITMMRKRMAHETYAIVGDGTNGQ